MTTPTVRAVRTDQNGSVQIDDIHGQSLGRNDVRVSVAAAAINPIDSYVVDGFAVGRGWSEPGPLGLGWDVAGIISEVGPDVDDATLTPGARVAGLSAGAVKEIGGQADDVVLPGDAVAIIPSTMTFVDAASLPLNTLTADLAVSLLGEPSGTLLVTGIGGAVGGYAAPLALSRGWRVVGLGRPVDREYAASVGVDFITELDTAGTPFDAVIDAANLGAQAADSVRREGTLVELVGGNTPATEGLTVHSVMVAADGPRLGELLEAAARGELPIRVRSTFGLDAADKAYAAFRDGGRGRVVLVTDLAV